MENVVNRIGDLGESWGGKDGVSGDAIAANGEVGDEGEVGGSNQGGVALQLYQLPGAYQYGPEFQYGEPLAGSGRDAGLQVEEGYF